MVAYNLLLSILPLALLALFITGRVLGSGHLENSVLTDLRQLFPDATQSTLRTCFTGSRGTRRDSASSRWSRECGSAPPSGARSTPPSADLRGSLPHLASAEALRSPDARLRAAVHGGDRRVPLVQSFLIAGKENLPFGSTTSTPSSTWARSRWGSWSSSGCCA